VVTNDIFVSFLHCERKAFLLASGAYGHPAEIETVQLELERVYLRQALETFLAAVGEQDVVTNPPSLEVSIKSRPRAIIDVIASGNGMSSHIQALERMKEAADDDDAVYSPVLFTLNEKVSRDNKLLLAFNAIALSSVQGTLPLIGKIVHGNSYRVLKCKIEPCVGEVRKLVALIQAAHVDGAAAPPVRLNRHCNSCQFQADCQRLAEEKDDLSLLRGMSEKEIEKQRNRGILTVTQFAYTYRPGRRGKRKTEKARKHDHALQAVAIRDKKVYVLDSPTVPRSRVALYLDIEGVPDRDFDYLIGLVAVTEEGTTTHSFWADDRTQEKAIWEACSQVINSFEDYTLYHYGQYELRFLERMRRVANEEGAAAIDLICARSCNVLGAIYSRIYFPTRSNGLKDIGHFLGATWTAANASGIQSLAWRLAWEASGDETLKQHLFRYNLEDCLVLRQVTEFVRSFCDGTTENTVDSGPAVASETDLQSMGGSHFGKIKFFCPELDHINKCAYSDYQRERIYVRTSPAVRKSLRRKQRVKNNRFKVNQEVMFPSPEVCPKCGGIALEKHYKKHARKVVNDLKFTASGVKRWCVCYRSSHSKCLQCGQTFSAEGYRSLGLSHVGRNLCSWAIYHHVALRQSGQDVALSLNEVFGYSFDRTLLTQIIPMVANQHRTTYQRLKDKLRRGPLVHADETKGVVKGHSGYVWTFTNLEEVVYVYTPTREGTILEEMLNGFTGVLVSDFYAAYDSLKCPQQKCLIHLMRDINNDIFHSPFDEELKELAQRLVVVLKPIIDTIDRFGLKKYYLNKHKEDVDRYFSYLSSQAFGSRVAQSYQKRMLKYQDKLFVFLDCDGIPWNNNNAENAIKPFASRRKIIQASFSERGLQDYLLFLSISQTCRNKNLSFLRFLRSGKLDIDAFANEAVR
jgi:predicted RecB family nuclease